MHTLPGKPLYFIMAVPLIVSCGDKNNAQNMDIWRLKALQFQEPSCDDSCNPTLIRKYFYDDAGELEIIYEDLTPGLLVVKDPAPGEPAVHQSEPQSYMLKTEVLPCTPSMWSEFIYRGIDTGLDLVELQEPLSQYTFGDWNLRETKTYAHWGDSGFTWGNLSASWSDPGDIPPDPVQSCEHANDMTDFLNSFAFSYDAVDRVESSIVRMYNERGQLVSYNDTDQQVYTEIKYASNGFLKEVTKTSSLDVEDPWKISSQIDFSRQNANVILETGYVFVQSGQTTIQGVYEKAECGFMTRERSLHELPNAPIPFPLCIEQKE